MLAGRVGRPHGLDGSFHVLAPESRLLAVGTPVEGLGEIVARKGTDAKPVIRLSAASDRTAVEALRGRPLEVSDALAPPLGEDEFWARDLEGCTVVDGAREVGVVKRLLGYPSCDLLELEDGSLVPLVRDCVRSVDVEARRIDIDTEFLGAT